MTASSKYFDAHLIGAATFSGSVPEQLSGALIFGANSRAFVGALCKQAPHAEWRFAETLRQLARPVDAHAAHVLDLQLSEADLRARLKMPAAEWWPLLGAQHGKSPLCLRLNLPPGPSIVKGARILAREFPRVHFIIDPFRHGPASEWQGQARMAECSNVWLTTLGMFPNPSCLWPRSEDAGIAMHFVSGEVGAGKLLFASGLDWNLQTPAINPVEWLSGISTLDDAQRALILRLNAADLFGSLAPGK